MVQLSPPYIDLVRHNA